MSFGSIKGGGKKGPSRVPAPRGEAKFVLGSRPSAFRSPTPKGIKPETQKPTRDYGKPENLPGFDKTGLTGES